MKILKEVVCFLRHFLFSYSFFLSICHLHSWLQGNTEFVNFGLVLFLSVPTNYKRDFKVHTEIKEYYWT